MTMPFGVTNTGFTAMTEADVLAAIEADQHAEISATLDVSGTSVLGKLNRIFARYMADAWTAAKAVHDGNDPDLARADAATSLAKITGTSRRGASVSQVDVTVELVKDTKLLAGQHFAHVTDRPGSRWTPMVDITAAADGVYTTRWRAELTGEIDTPINSISVIATPVVGWSRVVSSGEVAVGRASDTDEDLLTRRLQALALSGSSGVDQIRADVLTLAVSASVFENVSDSVDANGLPPKSFEAVCYAPNASDNAVAQAVWDSKPSGIRAVGSSSGTAIDGEGKPQSMRFSRSTEVQVFITCKAEPRAGYVGDTEFKATLATRLDSSMQGGQTVTEWDISEAAHGLGAQLSNIRFGTSPAPTTDTDLPLTTRQIARFDAGRIVLA